MTAGPISVVVSDDHPLVLEGLRNLIDGQADMEVVGETTDGLATIEMTRRLRPCVLVVDLMMSPVSGIEVMRQLTRDVPRTHIVVLSMHDELPYVREALQSGALAYVLKCASRVELLNAVRAAASGRRYLSPPLSEQIVEVYGTRARGSSVDPLETLTRRERQVLRFVAEGMTSAEVAAMLGIGVRTVESHRAAVLRKLDFKNQTELVRYAIQKGIILTP